jgi:N-acetylmuramoyl-L-alanine amidase
MKKTILYGLFLTPLLFVLPLLASKESVFNKKLTPSETTDSAELKGENTSLLPNDGKDYRIKKVVIDAGHGGHDSGCHGESGIEKKNTLAIALKLGEKIKANFPNVEIIYTRDKDEFIELHRRADIANKAKADLFISIHCNSTDENSGAFGTETYVLGMHKKEENFGVARRENGSILLENDYEKQYDGFDPNSNEAYIMFSLFQNAYLDKSILFGKMVEESFKNNAGRKSLGVKQAGFIVLKEATMPSVLIETGFLNHRNEGYFLSTADGQETISEAILLAFSKYKKSVETKEEEQVTEAKASPKRLWKSENAQNTDLSRDNREGVIFKIQLATSSRDQSQTKEWQSVEDLEVIKENNVYKYFKTGFNDYNETAAKLKQLKANGFGDAFIVVFKNGKRVSIDEVKTQPSNTPSNAKKTVSY